MLTLQNDFALELWQNVAVKLAGVTTKSLPEFPHLDNDLFQNGAVSLLSIADFDYTLHRSNEIVFLRNSKPVFACCNRGFGSEGCIKGDYLNAMSPPFELESADALIVLSCWKKIMKLAIDKNTFAIISEDVMLHPDSHIDACVQCYVASDISTVLNELQAKEVILRSHAQEEAQIMQLESQLKLLLDNTTAVEASLSGMFSHLDYAAFRDLKLNIKCSHARLEESKNEMQNLRVQIDEKRKKNETLKIDLEAITSNLQRLCGFRYLSCVFCQEDERVHVLVHRQAHTAPNIILKHF